MTDARTLILDAYAAALRAVDPFEAVRTTFSPGDKEQHELTPAADGSNTFDVIAIGKAAVPMMAGAFSGFGTHIRRGFVITKDGHVDRDLPPTVEVRLAAHPVLDQRSVSATNELLRWLADGDLSQPTICLISGGGSALLESPVEGVTLADFQAMTRLLLNAGADIHQLNAVRSRVSRVKGGGLRRAIQSEEVITLALSDVLGNDPSVIASGPTVPLVSGLADAESVIDQLGLRDKMPSPILSALIASGNRETGDHPHDRIAVIADNQRAVIAAQAYLHAAGLRSTVMWEARNGEARTAAVEWVDTLPTVDSSTDVVLGGGELTVTVRGDGMGGRNTEFALAAAVELESRSIRDWMVASLATDGQDAETGVAGAVVDGFSTSGMRAVGMDPQACLDRNDSLPCLAVTGSTVSPGPTGTNVNDLYFAVRIRNS